MAWALPGKSGTKVGVCIPMIGDVRPEWAFAFAQAIRANTVELSLYMNKQFAIDYARNDLVEMAIRDGCTHVLFWDSDIYPYRAVGKPPDFKTVELIPYPNFIDYMLYQEYPIVSGMYWTKRGFPNIARRTDDDFAPSFLTGPLEAFAGRHIYVHAVGSGCLLIDARVFQKVPYPWFHFVRSKEKDAEGNWRQISEDIYFGWKSTGYGFQHLVLGDLVCKHGHHVFDVWNNESEASLDKP
jgi:hypothetical protein